MAHGLDHVAGAGLALGADHRRSLADPAQRLAEVGGAAHERHGELPLVDVVGLVGRGQHLGLVDEVDTERLEDLGLDEVADAGLGHHRDRHRGLDALDHLGIAHAGDATVAADVGRHPLERHHGAGAGVLGDLGLLGCDDVHDDAALEHLGQAALDGEGTGDGLLAHVHQAIERGAVGSWWDGTSTQSILLDMDGDAMDRRRSGGGGRRGRWIAGQRRRGRHARCQGPHLDGDARRRASGAHADLDVPVRCPVTGSSTESRSMPGDVVLLAIKSQDTEVALRQLQRCRRSGAVIVCLQNGLENERLAARRFADVLSIPVMLPAAIVEPGSVVAWGAPHPGILDVGRYPDAPVDDAGALGLERRSAAGFASTPRPDIARWKRRKLLMNLGNAVQALVGLDRRATTAASWQPPKARRASPPPGWTWRRRGGRRQPARAGWRSLTSPASNAAAVRRGRASCAVPARSKPTTSTARSACSGRLHGVADTGQRAAPAPRQRGRRSRAGARFDDRSRNCWRSCDRSSAAPRLRSPDGHARADGDRR